MSLLSRLRRPRAFSRTTVVINVLLVLMLVAAATGSWLLLRDDEAAAAPDTTAVSRGQVVRSVSASGNVVSPSDVGVDFAAGGELTVVYVREGERVRKGQVLARVDSADAQDQIDSAEASLRQAQGQYAQVTNGPSDEDLAASNTSVRQAATSVSSAEQALRDARNVEVTSRRVANQQVRRTEDDVDDAERHLDDARSEVSEARQALSVASQEESRSCAASADGTIGPGTPACTTAQGARTSAQSRVTTAEQAVAAGEQALAAARDALVSALQTHATGNAQQRQSVHSAESSLASARSSYDYTVATARQQVQAPDAGEVESAAGQVDAAQVTLRTARRALDDTVLRSPVDGVVDSLSGGVGGCVGGAGGGGSATTGTSSTGTSSTDTSTASASTTASGFAVITSVLGLQVQADFSEADVSQVRLGQGASVSFDALEDTVVDASISTVATSSVVADNVVTYQVTGALDRTPEQVRVGQTVTMEVVLEEAEDALVVPSSAVTTTGNTSTVAVWRDGAEEMVDVEVGVVGDSVTEIVSGLEEGDDVVTSTGGGGGFPDGGIPELPGGGLGGGL